MVTAMPYKPNPVFSENFVQFTNFHLYTLSIMHVFIRIVKQFSLPDVIGKKAVPSYFFRVVFLYTTPQKSSIM
jgi:hypothetical protein